jgi:hypothetical protein
MAQSSPEGIVLGRGSTLVKMELSVSEKQQTDILEMGQITEKEETIQDIASEYHSVAYGKLIKELTDGETTADYIDRHIVQAMVDIAKEQPKYPIGGYAPGNYMCSCSTCKKEFIGDKRAVQCEPCAISMTKEGNGLGFAKARRMQGSSTVNAMLMDEIGQFSFDIRSEKAHWKDMVSANRKYPLTPDQCFKQETLEEVAERLYPINSTNESMEMLSRHQLNNSLKQEGFLNGIKSDTAKEYWFNQFQEQDNKMYSKEEVLEILNEFSIACYSPIEKFEIPGWFEQLKKK